MYNSHYTMPPPPVPLRTEASIYHSVNYDKKTPIKLMRQVTNGIGIGMTLLWVSSLDLSFSVMGLPQWFQRFYSDFNIATLVDGIVYSISFLLAYFIIRATVAIPGHFALPWEKVDTRLSVFAVGFGLGCSYLGSFLTQMLNAAITALTGYEATMPETETPESALGWVLYFISIAILPAMFEEMVFRGVVLQSLRQFGDRFAVFASALIFALAHGNLIQGPNTFIMGIVLASLVIYTGSMKIGILLHFCNNFFFSLIGAADDLSGGLPDAIYYVIAFAIFAVGVMGLAGILTRYSGVFGWSRGNYLLGGLQKALHLLTTPMMLLYILICILVIALYFVPAA